MGWLRDIFQEPGNDLTIVERIRYARAYILEMVGVSYIGIPTVLEDIRLLLDQRSEAQEDPAIRAVIPDEFFQNLNIWHVKVLLVNYAAVEMHQIDRVLWLECMARFISFSDDSDPTDNILGRHRRKDCMRRCRGALLITNPHRLMGLKIDT
ncbi:hypothetical protein J1N35_041271 [Gossypium stocksii]|uniref:Uncharacterized protein n=1 Tax=Gossypium stocksii TaxID=47602 RepID=A0A9D3UFN7_9ROSI|nr:hypothetical protein J1N35_041271 [Gossypium stocksii]